MPAILNRLSPLLIRIALLAPLAFSLITGILTAVTVGSGTRPGTLENLAVFKLDISRLDVVAGFTPEASRGSIFRRIPNGKRGILDDIIGAVPSGRPSSGDQRPSSDRGGRPGANGNGRDGDIGTAIGDVLGDGARGLTSSVLGQAAQSLLAGLDLPEWISLHPMTLCNGFFENRGDPNSGVRVRSCTPPGKRPNSLGEVLGTGGQARDMSGAVPLPRVLNESGVLIIDVLHTIIILLTVVFIFATVFSFLAVLANACAILLPHNKIIVISNALLAGTAGTFVTVGYVGSYIVASIAARRLNRLFDDFRVFSQLGPQFLGLGIAAIVLSLASAGLWGTIFLVKFRRHLLLIFNTAFKRPQSAGSNKV